MTNAASESAKPVRRRCIEWTTVNRLSENDDRTFWELLFFRLSGDHNSVVRQAIAGNSETPRVALEILVLDDDPLVRGALIRNVMTPEPLLHELVNQAGYDDTIEDWEMCLRQRTDLSAAMLKKIREIDYDLEYYIATDPSTPWSVLEDILQYSDNDDCREAVGEHPSITAELLWKLKDTNESAILRNEKSPSDLLQYIADMVELREGVIDMWHTGEIERIISHPNAPRNLLIYTLDNSDGYLANLIVNNSAISKDIRDRAEKIME